MKTHQFETFALKHYPNSGLVTTEYKDGTVCPVVVNKDHVFHAGFLDITPGETNLLHEITHHLFAFSQGFETCPIVWASAHGLPMPDGAIEMEWQITALSYFALGKRFRPDHAHEWSALYRVAQIKDPYELKDEILTVFNSFK